MSGLRFLPQGADFAQCVNGLLTEWVNLFLNGLDLVGEHRSRCGWVRNRIVGSMRINGPKSTAGVTGKGAAKRSSGNGAAFSLPGETSSAASASATNQTSAVQNVGALLALQSVDDALSGRKRKAVRRGNKMLDLLESIRLGLLSGQMPSHILEQLQRLSDQVEESGDERIDAVLAEIELRTQVEMAKLEGLRMRKAL